MRASGKWIPSQIITDFLIIFFVIYVKFCLVNLFLFPLSCGWGLSMMHTALYILWPVTHVFIGIEDQVGWARHVVLPFSFTHIIHSAICFVWVVWDVPIFLFTHHWCSYNTSQITLLLLSLSENKLQLLFWPADQIVLQPYMNLS